MGILVDSITRQAIYYSPKGTAYGSPSCCTCTSATKCISHCFSLSMFHSVMLHFFPGDASILLVISSLENKQAPNMCVWGVFECTTLHGNIVISISLYLFTSSHITVFFYSSLDIEVFLHDLHNTLTIASRSSRLATLLSYLQPRPITGLCTSLVLHSIILCMQHLYRPNIFIGYHTIHVHSILKTVCMFHCFSRAAGHASHWYYHWYTL